MSDLFIPCSFISNEYNSIIHDNLRKNEEIITVEDRHKMRGYVYGIHETKDGKKELFYHSHNHIVINGRRWLMQRAVGSSLTETPNQHNYTICWFGLGEGGVSDSNPLNPLYTPDQTEDLAAPIKIKGNTTSYDYSYDNSGYKKTFKKDENGNNAQMSFSKVNSEVLALFTLVLDYEDCPYKIPSSGAKISELGLYCASSENTDNNDFVLFSRYCLPLKIKTQKDKMTFLWFIYF